MNKTLAIATLAFATASGSAMAASLPEFLKPSLINLDHSFFEVPETTVDLQACTADHHTMTVHGTLMADRNDMQKQGLTDLPVRRFRRDLQTAFAQSLTQANAGQYKQGDFTVGFRTADEALDTASKTLKAQTGITLLFMPKASTLDPAATCSP